MVKHKARIHPPAKLNEIYVKRRTPANAYVKHARKLFEKGIKTILLHGLTASIEKACKVANLIE